MNLSARAKVVRAMETIARCVNDEEVFIVGYYVVLPIVILMMIQPMKILNVTAKIRPLQTLWKDFSIL